MTLLHRINVNGVAEDGLTVHDHTEHQRLVRSGWICGRDSEFDHVDAGRLRLIIRRDDGNTQVVYAHDSLQEHILAVDSEATRRCGGG